VSCWKLTLAYRGGAYAGWQRQDNALSVQQVVEEALARLLDRSEGHPGPPGPSEPPVTVAGAGRTDAGVHARGQVAHLAGPEAALAAAAELPPKALVHGTNRFLPEDVRVMAAARVPDGFHARKHAVGKTYLYRLCRADVLSPLDAPFVVRLAQEVDLDALREASEALGGRHDFTAFALAGGSHGQPFRTVERAEWLEMPTEAGVELRFRVAGEGFLRGMVRSLVGTLVEVGEGRRTVAEFRRLLSGRPRGEAGPTAPAHGLCLEEVRYGGVWTALESHP
jgi:tRNA pseudouridine38-40 synthase